MSNPPTLQHSIQDFAEINPEGLMIIIYFLRLKILWTNLIYENTLGKKVAVFCTCHPRALLNPYLQRGAQRL